jgi:hypothetical protein
MWLFVHGCIKRYRVVCIQVHALEAGMRARFAALRDSYQQQLDTLHVQVIEMDIRNPRKQSPYFPSQPYPQPSRMSPHSQHHRMHVPSAYQQPEGAMPAAGVDAGAQHNASHSQRTHSSHTYDLSAHVEGVWSSRGDAALREEDTFQVCSALLETPLYATLVFVAAQMSPL